MVLDPLSALSVAANVVQLVQAGGDLVSRAVELYKSPTGLLQQHDELLTSAQVLKHDAQALLDDSGGEYSESKDEKSLHNLAALCHELAVKLVVTLEELKPKSENRKWDAMRQTIRTAFRDSAINSLVERMKFVRDALNTHLLMTLKYALELCYWIFSDHSSSSNSKSLSLLKKLVQQRKDWNLNSQPVHLHPLEAIVTSVKYFREITNCAENEEDREPSGKKTRYSSGDYHAATHEEKAGERFKPKSEGKDGQQAARICEEEALIMPPNMTKWSDALLTSAQNARITYSQHAILTSLRFKEMKTRESSIHDAHKNTYNWVVETDDNGSQEAGIEVPVVNRWLRSGDGVFWMAGKAGSGKSTLMKHVTHQANLPGLLREWEAKKKMVICSFYFWNSGSRLQKSQEGLLRTLFYQIFHACPELIPELLPERCKHSDTSTDWSRMDLMQLLRRFVVMTFRKAAFCLFIDGLDECDEDPSDLIAVLHQLENPSIKLFLASRPWNCFEEAFGQDKGRTMRLEEHNRKDILCFVSDTISGCPGFSKLRQMDPECDSLITEIVNKAQGVFFWVFLVTRSLMRGLTNGDSFYTLRIRLGTFPPELEPYFVHMYKGIEEIYLQETSELLLASVTALEPHPIMLYQALLEQNIDAYEARCRAIFVESDLDTFAAALERTKKQVNARCQDLLEVTDCFAPGFAGTNPFIEAYNSSRVEFLHRTVSDFLRQPQMNALLRKHARLEYDPRSKIDRSFQAIFRSFEVFDHDIMC